MGVINVTPDSFSGDGIGSDSGALLTVAARLQIEGADILDVGGESTRPGYFPVDVDEELRRTIPALECLSEASPLPISIDTGKAVVARAALERGACLINDVSGLRDPNMAPLAAEAGCGLILVHNQPVPHAVDPVSCVRTGLMELVERACASGVKRTSLIVDPGLGFGKNWRQNLVLLSRMRELQSLGFPIVVGASRKATISRVLGVHLHDRLEGTEAMVAVSIAHGADMVRVHDCLAMVRVARTMDRMVRTSE